MTGHQETNVAMWPTFAIAFALAVGRVYIGMTEPPRPLSWQGSYEALAHVFIGGLLVAAVMGRGWQVPLFWGLVLVEVCVAVVTRI